MQRDGQSHCALMSVSEGWANGGGTERHHQLQAWPLKIPCEKLCGWSTTVLV